jgi:hypothetical protein
MENSEIQSDMMTMQKCCKVCRQEKPSVEFPKSRNYPDGYSYLCKVCKSNVNKIYRESNRQEIRAKKKEHYDKNAEKLRIIARTNRHRRKESLGEYFKNHYRKHRKRIIDRSQAYYDKNKEAILSRRKEKYQTNKSSVLRINYVRKKIRLTTDSVYRLTESLRHRLYMVLKAKGIRKTQSAIHLVGCTKPELSIHIENNFKPGMTWENYGPVWHVDHIKPCAKFDLANPSEQKKCFHYSNLQPLFGAENIKKGAKYDAPSM